jgi:hypothetical protein
MTMTKSKNSTLELRICGEDTYCFHLKFEGKVSYFDWHRYFLSLDHPFRLESNGFKKDNVVLKGPPRHLSGLEIADMRNNLVLDENGDQFVGYGKKHNWTHKC